MREKTVVVIGGPTASGKSGLALRLAERLGGVVVNADSMQVYRELRVLTARPDETDEARQPHRLYGVLPAAEACTVARWRSLALAEIAAALAAGRLPIVVGGTGLYISALVDGLAQIPEIPETVRSEARALRERLGPAAFHAELERLDPEAARRLAPGDTTRTLRAYEVVAATGRPIAAWQAEPAQRAPDDWSFVTAVLMPDRERLYANCDNRLRRMIDMGALDEVRALDALALPADLPAMKALGVPQFLAHLRGLLPLDTAVAQAQQATRNYAKRQMTWFRNQLLPRATATPAQLERGELPAGVA